MLLDKGDDLVAVGERVTLAHDLQVAVSVGQNHAHCKFCVGCVPMNCAHGYVWSKTRSGWSARRGMLRISKQLTPELRFELVIARPGTPVRRTLHGSLAEAQVFAKILF